MNKNRGFTLVELMVAIPEEEQVPVLFHLLGEKPCLWTESNGGGEKPKPDGSQGSAF